MDAAGSFDSFRCFFSPATTSGWGPLGIVVVAVRLVRLASRVSICYFLIKRKERMQYVL